MEGAWIPELLFEGELPGFPSDLYHLLWSLHEQGIYLLRQVTEIWGHFLQQLACIRVSKLSTTDILGCCGEPSCAS